MLSASQSIEFFCNALLHLLGLGLILRVALKMAVTVWRRRMFWACNSPSYRITGNPNLFAPPFYLSCLLQRARSADDPGLYARGHP